MASQAHIRNPIEWGWDQITLAALTVGSLGRSLGGSEESRNAPLPAVYRIKVTDLRDAAVRGLDDFGAERPEAAIMYVRRLNRRGDTRHPPHVLTGGR